MIELKTRRIKASDYNKLRNIDFFNEIDEEGISDYLRISEDGEYLIYCKRTKARDNKDNEIGLKVVCFVYSFKRKKFMSECNYCNTGTLEARRCGRIYISAHNMWGRDYGNYKFEF